MTPSEPPPMVPAPLRIRLLGPVDVAVGDRPVPLTAAKQRAVLAMLALEVGRAVSTEALIEGVWGSRPPASARTTLKSVVSRLRRILSEAGNGAARLVAAPPGYVLEADGERVDARRFQALVGQARRALAADDPAAAAALLEEALSLWRGPALADMTDFSFAGPEAARLEETRLAAVEDMAAAELALGRHEDVVSRLEPHVAANPFRERAWGQLMVALYRSGRQAQSLRAYQDLRRVLGEELGIEPAPELRRLEEQILLQRIGGTDDLTIDVEAAQAGRTNLPVLLSRFIGRDTERRRLGELLASSRLVTLTGSGGVGKTRLAIEVARSQLPSFPDGVLFVDLAPISQPDLIGPELAAVLELGAADRQGTPEALVEHLVESLRGRGVLLVFDNCEHLLAGVGALVGTLLRRCSPLVVLATSRERLGVAGETVWRVPSLSMPSAEAVTPAEQGSSDAVELFCERARSLDADFALTVENASDIGRICRRVEGIPLAIELAAARLGALGPAEIAERLDERFALLTRGAAGAPTRHQTLRACMDWGHGLLREPERIVLRRLSVFAGSFDIEAAEAINSDPVPSAEVLDLLARLVDTSWVAVEAGPDGTRFRLTESVRQYAADSLRAVTEEHMIRARHRDHFLLVASGYLGPPLCATRRWLTRVAPNYENLRSALSWSEQCRDADACVRLAGHLFPYWALDGRFLEGRRWLEGALDSDTGPARPARTWALVALGLLVAQLGDVERGLSLWESAHEVATSDDDSLSAAYAMGYLGAFAFQRAEPETADALLRQARDTFEDAGARLGVAWCDFNRSFALLAGGDRTGATLALERALGVGDDEGSDVLVTHASSALASLVALEGDRQRALALADGSVAAARRLGLRHVLVMALTRAAEAAVLAGHDGSGEMLLAESLQTLRELGGRMWVSDALQLAAVVLEHGGRLEQAIRLLSAGEGKAVAVAPGGHRPIQVLVDETRARLADRLDTAVFDSQSRAGASLSSEEAMAEALLALSERRPRRQTFMFTDIVGSTSLAEALGDEAWVRMLHQHDETLRSLFASHAGEEIKHTGDGFFVAFAEPAHAVECAVAIQEHLARDPGQDGSRLRVRIGLHETDATREGRDYHGRGIHEAARIAARADGGEILASLTTVKGLSTLVSEPRTVTLKGISVPVEVVAIECRRTTAARRGSSGARGEAIGSAGRRNRPATRLEKDPNGT